MVKTKPHRWISLHISEVDSTLKKLPDRSQKRQLNMLLLDNQLKIGTMAK